MSTGDIHGLGRCRVARVAGAWKSAWLIVSLATACATGAPVHHEGPSPAPATATICPFGPPADLYRSSLVARPPKDPFALQLKAELDRWMKKLGQSALVYDARLDQVAYDVARLSAEKNVPSSSVVTFLVAHYGAIEPQPNMILMSGEHGAEASAVGDLGRQVSDIHTASTWRKVGIGIWRAGNAWNAALAFQEHNLTLDPVPRTLASGGQTLIAGKIADGYQSPEVLLTSPKGAVEHLPTQVHGRAFKAHLACSLGDGAYQVEIFAEDRRGPTVLANFPVYCGVSPPVSLVVSDTSTGSSSDPDEVERQILDLMDRDRAANGLPPLQRDARLARVARGYSREMAASAEVAHISQQSGNAVDRVRAAALSPMPTVVAENVGRDYSADAIERGFMSSPGHRDNILSRAVTHVGVGVATGKREGNATPIFVTQMFAGWGQ